MVCRNKKESTVCPDIVRQADGNVGRSYAADVVKAFSIRPYFLPTKHLYDARGSLLFDQYVASSPQYYPLVEADLARARAGSLREIINPQLVELGSGSCRRLRQLLELSVLGQAQECFAVDVSETPLVESLTNILNDYPRFHATACIGDFEHWNPANYVNSEIATTILWLGNTVANFTAEQVSSILTSFSDEIRGRLNMILGTDIGGRRREVRERFPDSLGLFDAFRWNALDRLNTSFNGNFDPGKFRLHLHYNETLAQAESFFSPVTEHSVKLKSLSLSIPFRADDTLTVGMTRDYDRDSLAEILAPASWRVEAVYGSDSHGYALVHCTTKT